jgi:hypothetical protein
MSRAEVEPGICGFPIVVGIRKIGLLTVSVSLAGDCGQVVTLGALLPSLTRSEVLEPVASNPVYLAAGRAGLHAGCPVPGTVIKAAEVEFGLALCRDVHIRIIKDAVDRALAQD